MKILVTGASGFVGRRLCARLAADGHDVVAATRRDVSFDAGVCNVAVGDLRTASRWDVVEGCDAVVHLAAHVHRLKDTEENRRAFREVNVDSTARLVEACESRGVRRFVFLSTVKVHGESSGGRPFDETSPIAPVDEYARSKAEAEDVVRAARMPSVILRPPLVYGPGVGANFLALLRAVADRRPLPLGAVKNRRSLVFVDNLVDAIARCVEVELESSAAFLVSDGEPVSTPELVRRLAEALEVKARLVAVPVSLVRLGSRLVGRHDEVSRLVGSLEVDDSQIRETTGWVPGWSLADGLQVTARWYRAGAAR